MCKSKHHKTKVTDDPRPVQASFTGPAAPIYQPPQMNPKEPQSNNPRPVEASSTGHPRITNNE